MCREMRWRDACRDVKCLYDRRVYIVNKEQLRKSIHVFRKRTRYQEQSTLTVIGRDRENSY